VHPTSPLSLDCWRSASMTLARPRSAAGCAVRGVHRFHRLGFDSWFIAYTLYPLEDQLGCLSHFLFDGCCCEVLEPRHKAEVCTLHLIVAGVGRNTEDFKVIRIPGESQESELHSDTSVSSVKLRESSADDRTFRFGLRCRPPQTVASPPSSGGVKAAIFTATHPAHSTRSHPGGVLCQVDYRLIFKFAVKFFCASCLFATSRLWTKSFGGPSSSWPVSLPLHSSGASSG
jgi:hypothetical protein